MVILAKRTHGFFLIPNIGIWFNSLQSTFVYKIQFDSYKNIIIMVLSQIRNLRLCEILQRNTHSLVSGEVRI